MRWLLVFAALMFAPVAAQAQGQGGAGCGVTGTPNCQVTSVPQSATTTESAGTIATGGTFQSALASNTSRKGCTLQYTGSATLYVFLGATGSATTANSFRLGPQGVFYCAGPSVLATDNVAVTAAASSDTYVISSQ